MVSSNTHSQGDPRRPSKGKQRPRLRLAPELRRSEILDGALAVFSEQGYEHATLENVAERIGVTKGCLYHHFDSKEQLLVELIRDRIEDSVRTATEREAREESQNVTLTTRLRRIWDHYQEPGQTEVSMLAISELAKIPEAGRYLVDEVISRSRAPLRDAIRSRRSPGASDAAESERAALVIPLMVLGAAIGLRLYRSLDPDKFSDKQVAQLGDTVTAILEHGCVAARHA
jgi:AcrR family transcriptional regulator